VRLLYKPIGLILGISAGMIGKRLFDQAWALVDDQDPPKATTQQTTWLKVLLAAAFQGAIFKATRAAVDRAGVVGWDHVFGVWAGEKAPEPKDDD
jgi:hypothetical protein